MTVNKLTLPAKENAVQSKINEIIDNLGGNMLEQCYPVGSIYMSVNNVSPATLFGFGTWEQIKDTFLLACGDTYSNADTGGASTVTLTTDQIPSHNHSASSDSTGAHTHARGKMEIKGAASWQANGIYSGSWGYATADNDVSGALTLSKTAKYGGIGDSGADSPKNGIQINFQASKNWTGATESKGDHTHTITVNANGGGQAHDNMPPYLAVNIWKRTA